MVNCRTLALRDEKSVVVYEREDVVDPSTGKSLTGAWVWDAAIALAAWFATDESWPEGSLTDKKVIEVGAGVGLPGVALAALGADVTITDRPVLLPSIQANIVANKLEAHARVAALDWSGKVDLKLLADPPDMIVGSDIMYDRFLMPDLVATLQRLAGEKTRIFLSCELREGIDECFRVFSEMGMRWRAVDSEKMHPDWRSEDIKIFEFFVPPLGTIVEKPES